MPLSKADAVNDCIVKLPSTSFADIKLFESYAVPCQSLAPLSSSSVNSFTSLCVSGVIVILSFRES